MDLYAARFIADGGAYEFLFISLSRVEISGSEGIGGEFRPKITTIGKKPGGGPKALAAGSDHVAFRLIDIGRSEFHLQATGINQPFPSDLKIESACRDGGLGAEFGRAEFTLPSRLGEGSSARANQRADRGFPFHAC